MSNQDSNHLEDRIEENHNVVAVGDYNQVNRAIEETQSMVDIVQDISIVDVPPAAIPLQVVLSQVPLVVFDVRNVNPPQQRTQQEEEEERHQQALQIQQQQQASRSNTINLRLLVESCLHPSISQGEARSMFSYALNSTWSGPNSNPPYN